MTTVELRTSIMEELDQMSVEMLESVSKYVKRLRHHTRSARKVKTDQNKRESLRARWNACTCRRTRCRSTC